MSSSSFKESSKPKTVEYTHRSDSLEVNAGKLTGSRILPENVKKWWVLEVARPIENRLVRMNLSPNQISLIGLFFCVLACWMVATGHLIVGGFLVFIGGSFDFLDGRVARITGRQTESGAFFDSVLDRYMDALLFLGPFLLFESMPLKLLVVAAWFGSSATSYVRAKSESLGQECRGGAMQRPERILYVGAGLCLSGYWEYLQYPFQPAGWESSRFFLIAAIAFIALVSNFVALQRIWTVFQRIRASETR